MIAVVPAKKKSVSQRKSVPSSVHHMEILFKCLYALFEFYFQGPDYKRTLQFYNRDYINKRLELKINLQESLTPGLCIF